ncbi:MAG: hypothetical protein RIR70_112 [Pseudomonadota bacterium]|jgi:polyhydroxyalkanoate synthase
MASQRLEQITPDMPDAAEIAQTYAEVATRASKLISEHVQRQARHGVMAPQDELGIAQAFMDMMSLLMQNPYKLAHANFALLQDYFSLWQRSMMRFMGLDPEPLVSPAKGDNRFRDADWQEHFVFDYIKQTYLITARHIHDVVSCVEGLDENTQRKVNFFTRQYIDALSPSNFAITNPEVFRETFKSHGQNLIKGFNNLLRDIEEGDGQLRIKMTDVQAFELGRNVATTPGKVVYQNALMQLIQYTPTTAQVLKRPLLIVPPWINKYYILDLREKNSMIKWAVEQGHTVFVMSWVNPDEKLAEAGFDAYLQDGTLAALDAIEKQTGEKEINAAGYCLGGTLLATTLAYCAAKGDRRIASATFFTTLLDFSQPGELGVFLDEKSVEGLEKKMSERGYLDGSDMASTFNMLRSNDLIWSFVVNNYLMGRDPFPFDLLFWNSDSTRMPCRMHSFYLRNMYLENRLREPGGIALLGTPIDLSLIKAPTYFISTQEDHIAPWRTTYLGARLMQGDTRFVLGGSGHIAGIVNPPAANKYGYCVNPAKTLPADADDWFNGATHHEGSWWNDWAKWLAKHDGEKVPARDPAQGKLGVVEDAPGSYAKLRLDSKGS